MIGMYLALLILLVCISIALLHYSDIFRGDLGFLAGLVGLLGLLATCVTAFAGLVFAYDWYAASYQAQIINREYDTQYTQAEVFYASNVIDAMRMLDRKRIELNGDLMGTRPDHAQEAGNVSRD